MVLPIYAYGHESLRQETEPVTESTDELQTLIDDMIETMYAASGLGLAAPQVGRSERLFVVDVSSMADELRAEGEQVPPQPMVIINPEITAESDGTTTFEEGCLSIPEIREAVTRPERIRLKYQDRNLETHEIEVGSMLARVFQHEFDHLEGVLFTDYLSSFRKRLLRRSLRKISEGDVDAHYPMKTKDGDRVSAVS